MVPGRKRGSWAILLLLALALPAAGQDTGSGDPPRPPGPGEPDEPALPPGLGEPAAADPAAEPESRRLAERLPAGLHGFAEARVGPRTQGDPAHSEAFTLAELRVQAEYARACKHLSVDVKGDLILDGVTDEVRTDLRRLLLTASPAEAWDLGVGRQTITWGTGDLLFINDLFPKDWQSFFAGRDEEYLKAPSDALRLGWFGSPLNVDLVYTPRFDVDRYIRGERFSYFDPRIQGLAGDAAPLAARLPDETFTDDELALRVHGGVGSYEFAGYAYRGFWKSPSGFDGSTAQATFPALDVFGASARGPMGPGIGNVEAGYYASRDDPHGTDALVGNSELRLLVGYELELAREFTGGFQVYLERLLDHARYLQSLPAGTPRDETRKVLTVRLTRLLRRQTVTASLFAYYSPSDRDGYLRPRLTYRWNDSWTLEAGANVFLGREEHTFFGQFENDTNVYVSARFSL